jgi:Helitron helicase-like domain at N-terminus
VRHNENGTCQGWQFQFIQVNIELGEPNQRTHTLSKPHVNTIPFHSKSIGTGPSQETVSCMHFYVHHFMIRRHSFNQLLRNQNLFNEYAVEMAVKTESERLTYIRTHHQELRAESYIRLQIALNSDADTAQLGQLCILPSTFTGRSRSIHERTQDTMTYVTDGATISTPSVGGYCLDRSPLPLHSSQPIVSICL